MPLADIIKSVEDDNRLLVLLNVSILLFIALLPFNGFPGIKIFHLEYFSIKAPKLVFLIVIGLFCYALYLKLIKIRMSVIYIFLFAYNSFAKTNRNLPSDEIIDLTNEIISLRTPGRKTLLMPRSQN